VHAFLVSNWFETHNYYLFSSCLGVSRPSSHAVGVCSWLKSYCNFLSGVTITCKLILRSEWLQEIDTIVLCRCSSIICGCSAPSLEQYERNSNVVVPCILAHHTTRNTHHCCRKRDGLISRETHDGTISHQKLCNSAVFSSPEKDLIIVHIWWKT
jgi:hypothetical protein